MNKDKLLTLFMGRCWHERTDNTQRYRRPSPCVCGKEYTTLFNLKNHFRIANPDRLSNPLPVIRWMEKEMPEVWEKYLKEIFAYKGNTGFELPAKLNKALDLSNLITYLSEHREEWGWEECPQVNCMSPECRENPECAGSGKIKHPALIYLESEEAKDE